MSEELLETGETLHPILHETKTKYRQLATSLLLTSSLMSHKQKINKQRQEQGER